ncbi:MAG TPA: PA domain-containing protein, partial [Beutenbergiaceae bacterium]|nr:PA domain-containing protein [Beutenbergiaceae bacterium]
MEEYKMSRFGLSVSLVAVALALLLGGCHSDSGSPPGDSGPQLTFSQAVDQLLSRHYPQHIVKGLDRLGDSPLGFRMAGTPAGHAAANFLAAQFSATGISRVRKEPVPVDAWTLQGASVRVGGRRMTASQFPGIRGTNGPLTAPIVYVGQGLASDYKGKDVAGKLVLIDRVPGYWHKPQGHEAKLHGAAGIVFTDIPGTAPDPAGTDTLV